MGNNGRRVSGKSRLPQHECPICKRTFVRKEHLRRHQTIHTKEKSYHCSTCGKHFSRADTLARHTAFHRDEGVPSPNTPAIRACNQCAASHVRCSREEPCHHCSARGLLCEYALPNSADTLPPAQGEQSENGSYVQEQSPEEQMFEANPPSHSLIDPEMSNVAVVPAWPAPAPSLSVQNPDPYTNAYFRDPGFAVDFNQQVLSTNWWSPDVDDAASWQIQQELMSTNIFPLFDAQIFSSNPACDVEDVSNSTPLQIGRISLAQENPSTLEPLMELQGSPESAYQGSVTTSGEVGSTRRSTVGRYYVDGVAARAALPGRFHDQESTTSPNSLSAQSTLELSGNPTTTLAGRFLSPNSYTIIRRNLSQEASSRGKDIPLPGFPTFSEMNWHVEAYFDKFHATLPFLRKATFHGSEPYWLLTFAVATVGAHYTMPGSAQTMHDLLDESLHRHETASQWRGGEPFKFLNLSSNSSKISDEDLQALQAAILNTLLMLLSGVHDKIHYALLEKSRLTEICDSRNLLRPVGEPRKGNKANRPITGWLERQALLRTGMMIWLMDTVFAYTLNSSPRMVFVPPETQLPSSEKTWEMPSEGGIAAEEANSLTLSHALEMLYMEKRLPKHLGDFAHILLIHAICRRTKEVFLQAQSQLSFWTPSAAVQTRISAPATEETWPPSHEMCVKWRNSACDSLDILHWQANSRIAESAGWEHSTVLHLHLARLIILTPTVHLQTLGSNQLIIGNPGASMSSDNTDTPLTTARKHLIKWATQDQYKARLAVIHAGAICWHIRRYSVNNVLEPFAVYMATLVIWAYSVVLVSSKLSSRQAQTTNTDLVLDPDTDQSRPFDVPIQRESSVGEAEIEPSLVYVDRPCDDEMVQNFARVGNKMIARMRGIPDISAAEAPRKILQEGIGLLRSATGNPESSRQTSHTPQREISSHIWGIQKQYLESLTWLESKSG